MEEEEKKKAREKEEQAKQEKAKAMEQYFADVVMEMPYGFTATADDGKKYDLYLYPVTLGKMFLLQRYIEALSIEPNILVRNEMVEMLRIVHERYEECLQIIFIHTCQGKSELFDMSYKAERMELLRNVLNHEDIATLITIVLTNDHTNEIMIHYGIDKEMESLQQVVKVKSSKNDMSFGGKTIMGTFVAQLLELGLSYEEIIWERSYSAMRLLLSDKVTSMYLSDDDLAKLPSALKNRNEDIIRPTKENMAIIHSMNWK